MQVGLARHGLAQAVDLAHADAVEQLGQLIDEEAELLGQVTGAGAALLTDRGAQVDERTQWHHVEEVGRVVIGFELVEGLDGVDLAAVALLDVGREREERGRDFQILAQQFGVRADRARDDRLARGGFAPAAAGDQRARVDHAGKGRIDHLGAVQAQGDDRQAVERVAAADAGQVFLINRLADGLAAGLNLAQLVFQAGLVVDRARHGHLNQGHDLVRAQKVAAQLGLETCVAQFDLRQGVEEFDLEILGLDITLSLVFESHSSTSKNHCHLMKPIVSRKAEPWSACLRTLAHFRSRPKPFVRASGLT